MRWKLTVSAALFFLCLSTEARQKDSSGFSPTSLYSISYTLGLPMGSFSDFMPTASFAGGTFSGQYFLYKGFAVGFEFGFSNYHQDIYSETYFGKDGIAVTGTQFKYAFIIPWKAGAYYYFLPGSVASPMLGLAMGASYMEEHILIQEFDFDNKQWGFILAPVIGVQVRFGKTSHWAAVLSTQYWLNTNSFEFSDTMNYSQLQGFNINLGVSYLLK